MYKTYTQIEETTTTKKNFEEGKVEKEKNNKKNENGPLSFQYGKLCTKV